MSIFSNFFKFKCKNHEKEVRYILSIDGGGIRGLIPATILEHLQEMLDSLGENNSIANYFDLITGTSTGGVIALSLASRNKNNFFKSYKDTEFNNISDIKAMYTTYANQVFPSDYKPFKSVGQLWKSKYSDTTFNQLLNSVFGEQTLNETLVPVSVISYDMIKGSPFIFSSKNKGDFKIKDAARATSAAPTYFDALELKDTLSDEKYSLVDGGVIANNPVLFAYIEARELYPNADEYVILSLGTCGKTFSYGSSSPSGFLGWVDPRVGATIQQVYATSQMQQIDLAARALPNTIYQRINSTISGEHISMDSTDKKDLERLENTANDIIEKNESLFSVLCADLINNRSKR